MIEKVTSMSKTAIAAIGALGAIIGSLLTYGVSSKELDYGAYSNIMTRYEERLKQCEENEKRIIDLEISLANMKGYYAIVANINNTMPLPQVIKDPSGKILTVNKQYEEAFLKPIGQTIASYILGTDYDVFPKEVADEYRTNDLWVYNTGKTWVGTEQVCLPDGYPKNWVFVKYPVKLSDNKTIIGIGFLAIPSDEISKYLKGIR